MPQRESLVLQSHRFTNTSALAKDILALLECTDYKLEVRMTALEFERVSNELESCRSLGRVTCVVGEKDSEAL